MFQLLLFFLHHADNYVHDNLDAGIAMLESFGAEIYDNRIENCKYGIRLSLGCADNDIHDNTFDASSQCEFALSIVMYLAFCTRALFFGFRYQAFDVHG